MSGTLRHVEITVFLNTLIRFKLEQLLRDGGDRAGRGGGAGDAEQALMARPHEPAQPQKTAADQVDCLAGFTRRQRVAAGLGLIFRWPGRLHQADPALCAEPDRLERPLSGPRSDQSKNWRAVAMTDQRRLLAAW